MSQTGLRTQATRLSYPMKPTYGFLKRGEKTAFRMRANHYHVSFAPSNVLKSYFLSFVSENRRIFAACKY